MTTPADVIARAERWLGFVETPVNRTPFGAWFGMQGQPYCAMALSMWNYEAGLPIPASTPKGYAYTPSGANWFQARNWWGTTPRKGAHVFFRFSGPRIHHVGLVTSDDGVFPIQTIEANTSRGSAGSQRDGGGVWRRSRAAGIVGYGYPNYDEEDTMNAEQEQVLRAIDDVVRGAYNSATQARDIASEVWDRLTRVEAVVNAELGETTKDSGSVKAELDEIRRNLRQAIELAGGKPKN